MLFFITLITWIISKRIWYTIRRSGTSCRQPALWLHNPCPEVLTAHGSELHLSQGILPNIQVSSSIAAVGTNFNVFSYEAVFPTYAKISEIMDSIKLSPVRQPNLSWHDDICQEVKIFLPNITIYFRLLTTETN